MFSFSLNIYSILTEIYIILCSCFLLLVAVFFSTNLIYGYVIICKYVKFIFLQIIVFSFLLSLNQYPIYLITWNGFLIVNSFSFYSKLIILSIIIFWFFFSFYNINIEKIYNFEYWILILFNVISSLLLLKSNDLLSTYLLIEFQSLIFYILTSFKRNSEFSTEAGIKYFILGALSSALLLFGFSILYNLTGLTNFNDLYIFFLNLELSKLYNIVFLSLILILISLLFKLNVAPFHIWSPDVYEGSPSSVTAFFSLIPKLIIINLLLKFLLIIFYDIMFIWYYVISFCIIFSSLIGSLLAFKQLKWKRFIVYSSINHLSFILLALLLINNNSLFYLFQYLIVYLIMNIGFFSIFLNIYYLKTPFTYQFRFLNNVNLLVFLNPILSFSFLIILFSMAGIPPLAGFFIKFFVLYSSLSKTTLNLILFILIFNVISCFYYIRLIKNIYFSFEIPKYFYIYLPFNKSSIIVLGICVYLLMFMFFDFEFLFLFLNLISFSFI